jgi:drug/metabolite transporter (DMT)-like permease
MKTFSLKKYIPISLLFIAAFIFGISFSAQKEASAIPAFTMVSIRGFIAALFLFALLPLTDRLQGNVQTYKQSYRLFTKPEILGGIVCGTLLALASVLQQAGIGDGTDAGKASFITALYIVIVPILGLFSRKLPKWNVWLSVLLATIGFFLLCIKEEFHLSTSDFLVLLCAFAFSLQIVAIDFFAPKGDGVRISCIQFLTTGIICGALALILETPIVFQNFATYLPQILYLAIGSSGIGYTLQIVAQRNTPPTATSLVLSLESVFGAIAAAILLGETLTPKEFLGCVVVFTAVILAQVSFPKRKKSK